MNRILRPQLPQGLPHSGPPFTSRSGVGLVPIIAKTDFSFDGRTSTNQDAVLATGIDSRGWKSGVVVVRLHAKNSWSGSAILSVNVDNVSLDPVDPSVVFVGSRVASPSISSGATAPLLTVASLNLATIGEQLQVSLRWSQGATPAGAAQTLSISIDLLGRPR
jgi:hypothetical protein